MVNTKKDETVTETVAPDTTENTSTDVVVIDEETEVAVSSGSFDVTSIIESMNDTSKVVTTITGTDFDARLALAAALTTSEPLADHLNELINLVDYVITEVTIVDKQTGVANQAPRIVLVDETGEAFHATSIGLLTSLRNIRLAVGSLWGERPVPVKVVRQRGSNGFSFFTVNIVR